MLEWRSPKDLRLEPRAAEPLPQLRHIPAAIAGDDRACGMNVEPGLCGSLAHALAAG